MCQQVITSNNMSTQQAQQRKAASVHLQALFNHATDLAAGQCSGVASAQLRNAIQQAANNNQP